MSCYSGQIPECSHVHDGSRTLSDSCTAPGLQKHGKSQQVNRFPWNHQLSKCVHGNFKWVKRFSMGDIGGEGSFLVDSVSPCLLLWRIRIEKSPNIQYRCFYCFNMLLITSFVYDWNLLRRRYWVFTKLKNIYKTQCDSRLFWRKIVIQIHK